GPPAPSMQRPASAGPPTSVAPLPVAPARSRRPPGRRRRLRLPRKRWLWLAIPLVPLLLVAGFGLYLYSLFAGVNRVDLSGVLTPQNGPGVNYLIAGSDQRADGSVAGERADTLIVMRVGDGTPKMMSIPRDLWVPISGTDGSAKINAAYNGGPARLVATVQSSLEIPIHHYVEVDFVTFGSLVDAVGGVTINFPHPAFDTNSGLSVDQTGPVELDGEQALAYVRSRHYTEVIDGVPREDPTADLGRQLRQQEFMKAVMGKVGATRNPVGLTKVARALGKDLTIDDDLSAFGALGLARGLAGTSPDTLILPTAPGREGAQSVLFLQEQAAIPILDQLR
ncbi:MAG: LCP family protein, partial [Candidatus Microthrix parvicella]